jgi:DNA repair exonuclease SbcCD nuclease subunit
MSKITRELVLPPSVKVFGDRAEALELRPAGGGADVVIHGLSFRDRRAPESLLPLYRPPVDGAVNIGLMHTSLGGSERHDPYAPVPVADLRAAGFRYWALGHIHQRSISVDGATTIVMPGIPQGRDINEAGQKSVSLVQVGDDGTITVDERTTALARFDRLQIDLGGIVDWDAAVAAVGRKIEASGEGDLHHILRLGITGATPLAWRIRRELDLIKAEADHVAERLGSVSIEKVETTCVPLETKAAAATEDPLSELARLIEADILQNHAFLAEAGDAADELLKSLPAELRGFLGQEEGAFSTHLDHFARDGVLSVLARLREPGGEG